MRAGVARGCGARLARARVAQECGVRARRAYHAHDRIVGMRKRKRVWPIMVVVAMTLNDWS